MWRLGRGVQAKVPLLAVVWGGLVLSLSAPLVVVFLSAIPGMLAQWGYQPVFEWRRLAFSLAGHTAWLAVPAAILAVAWWAGRPLFSLMGVGKACQ